MSSRGRRRSVFVLVLILLVLAVLVLFVQAWHKAHRPQGYDLTCFLLASRALTHGGDPYRIESPFPFRYPLFVPLAMAPLTLVPYDVTVVLWFLINLGSLIGALCLSFRLGPRLGVRPPTADDSAVALDPRAPPGRAVAARSGLSGGRAGDWGHDLGFARASRARLRFLKLDLCS
jgi:hypothetical protein